uniref:Uncharacterized protein n=1 Tax=Populus trichocarpa TaxID=3694 RepID=A0A2K2C0G2_POPTR
MGMKVYLPISIVPWWRVVPMTILLQLIQVHGCLPLSGGAFCCPLTLLCPIGTWSCVDLLCFCSRCNV